MTVHHCHADGCDVPMAPKLFMCLKHWSLVPFPLQREIWKYYRRGQERDKDPSADYMRVARQAIRAVAEKEGRIPPAPGRSETPSRGTSTHSPEGSTREGDRDRSTLAALDQADPTPVSGAEPASDFDALMRIIKES